MGSCQPDNTLTPMDDPFEVENRKQDISADFPEKIPADLEVHDLLADPQTDWRTLENYYRETAETHRERAYFANLQWAVFQHLLTNPTFLREADPATLRFYEQELFDRSYLNDPSVVATFLEKLSERTVRSPGETAARARAVERQNRIHLSEANFQNHRTAHSGAYSRLTALGYDRWGTER